MRKITIEIETDSEEPFDLIKEDIEQELSCCWNWFNFDTIKISEGIEAVANEVERKRGGKWILVKGSNGKDYHKCSECLHEQDITGVKNYCAVCGADMLGEEDAYCPNCGAEMAGEKE